MGAPDLPAAAAAAHDDLARRRRWRRVAEVDDAVRVRVLVDVRLRDGGRERKSCAEDRAEGLRAHSRDGSCRIAATPASLPQSSSSAAGFGKTGVVNLQTIALVAVAVAFGLIVIWRARPAIGGGRRGGFREAVRSAQVRIEAAKDDASKALALCDAADACASRSAAAAPPSPTTCGPLGSIRHRRTCSSAPWRACAQAARPRELPLAPPGQRSVERRHQAHAHGRAPRAR